MPQVYKPKGIIHRNLEVCDQLPITLTLKFTLKKNKWIFIFAILKEYFPEFLTLYFSLFNHFTPLR